MTGTPGGVRARGDHDPRSRVLPVVRRVLALPRPGVGALPEVAGMSARLGRLRSALARRSAREGANLGVTALLLLGVLVGVNYVANRRNVSWDLTAGGPVQPLPADGSAFSRSSTATSGSWCSISRAPPDAPSNSSSATPTGATGMALGSHRPGGGTRPRAGLPGDRGSRVSPSARSSWKAAAGRSGSPRPRNRTSRTPS